MNIINHISYQLFQAKLNFLTVKGYAITNDNGILCAMFCDNYIKIKEKYHVSIEELMNNYYTFDEDISLVYKKF
jgi:uncharacterized Fe-S cluster-containing radical SAM superfamily enzyme